jgi:hypothetical protein
MLGVCTDDYAIDRAVAALSRLAVRVAGFMRLVMALFSPVFLQQQHVQQQCTLTNKLTVAVRELVTRCISPAAKHVQVQAQAADLLTPAC